MNIMDSLDLQKAFSFLKLSVSVAYYKWSIFVYNLSFLNFYIDNVKMYAWDETVASRDAQEVPSCILMHINRGYNYS